MNKQTGQMLLYVVIFTIIGAGLLILIITLFSHSGIKFVKRTEDSYYTEETFTAEDGRVTSVEIEETDRNVYITASEDGAVSVTYHTKKLDHYDIEISDGGRLTIERENELDTGMSDFMNRITGGWEDETYDLVISIPASLSGDISVSSVSGGIFLNGMDCGGELSLTSVSGEMSVSDVSCASAEISVTSGDVSLSHVDCGDGDLEITTGSGAINADGLNAAGLNIETVSGNVDFCNAGCSEVNIDSVSGDVTGEVYDIGFMSRYEAVSGIVELPNTGDSGRISVDTVSGNVRIKAVNGR